MRACFCALATAFLLHAQTWIDPNGASHDPFSTRSAVHVFVFLRADCPVAHRYAPELTRIANQFSSRSVDFWLIYPDRSEARSAVARDISEYGLSGTPLLDPEHTLVALADATVSPESAVFDHTRRLTYLGRIDDRVTGFGKSRPAATTHDLEDAIAATLEGKPVSEPRTRAFGCFLADVK